MVNTTINYFDVCKKLFVDIYNSKTLKNSIIPSKCRSSDFDKFHPRSAMFVMGSYQLKGGITIKNEKEREVRIVISNNLNNGVGVFFILSQILLINNRCLIWAHMYLCT